MNALMEPLSALKEFRDIRSHLYADARSGITELTGCIDSQKLHMIHCLGKTGFNRLIVTFTEQRAREFCDEYRFFDRNVRYFPAKDILFYQSDIHGNELEKERIGAP